MTIVRVAGKGPRHHHQTPLVRLYDTDFDAKLAWLPGFALPDAFDLRHMEGAQYFLLFRLFPADAFGTLEQAVQVLGCVR